MSKNTQQDQTSVLAAKWRCKTCGGDDHINHRGCDPFEYEKKRLENHGEKVAEYMEMKYPDLY